MVIGYLHLIFLTQNSPSAGLQQQTSHGILSPFKAPKKKARQRKGTRVKRLVGCEQPID